MVDGLIDTAALDAEMAQRIRDRRLELGLSQSQLASRAGYSSQQIHTWESAIYVPRITAVRRLAQALQVTAGYLIEGKAA